MWDLRQRPRPASPGSTTAVQLALPGVPGIAPQVRRSRPRRAKHPSPSDPADPLAATYLRRLAARGAAPKGFAAYRYQLTTLLRIASRHAGRPITCAALFRDPVLLGRALIDDIGADGRQLSRWTLAQRRSAIRSFASLMGPELFALLREDPHAALDRALRGVAGRVGTGYRLTGGTPRRRGGYAPSAEEVVAVIAAAAGQAGFAGARNAAFFGILAESGSRVNALRMLDGSDCVMMPDGRLRIFLHAKGRGERREVELSRANAEALLRYTEMFTRHAATWGWGARIRLGEPGPIWRDSARGRWPYAAIVNVLRTACGDAGVRAFTPHALRRTFATEAASVLPRHVVALAGGWRGLERLDDHYVRVREARLWAKLQARWPKGGHREDRSEAINAPAPALARRMSLDADARPP